VGDPQAALDRLDAERAYGERARAERVEAARCLEAGRDVWRVTMERAEAAWRQTEVGRVEQVIAMDPVQNDSEAWARCVAPDAEEIARVHAQLLADQQADEAEGQAAWWEFQQQCDEQADKERARANKEREAAARRSRLAAWQTELAVAGELAELPAGPALAARVVETVASGDCSPEVTVELIAGLGRSVAYLEGLRADLVWSLVEPHGGSTLELRSIAEEIALRIGHTCGRVNRMIELGMGMAASPDLSDAVRTGQIGAAKASQILRDTDHLDAQRRDRVIAEVLSRHPEARNLPDLRRLTRTLAEWVDPRSAAQEHARARANRAVWIEKARHGMAFLHAYLPATDAWQVYTTLTTMALAEDPTIVDTPVPAQDDSGPHAAPGGPDGEPRHEPQGPDRPRGPDEPSTPNRPPGWPAEWERCPSDDDEPVPEDLAPPDDEPHKDDQDGGHHGDHGVDVAWQEYAPEWDTVGAHQVEVTRTLGNRRADALRDLFSPAGPLMTGKPVETVRPRLVVVARAEALLGSDEFPAELIGYGTLPAHAARAIARDATWSAIYCDPHTGRVAGVGTRTYPPGLTAPASVPDDNTDTSPSGHAPLVGTRDTRPPDITVPSRGNSRTSVFPPEVWPAEVMACHSYRPSAHVQATVTLRDESCRFPGCQRPAWACDLDHLVPFNPELRAIDQTIAANMQSLCRPHHRLKTLAGWDWERDPHTGVLTITSPQGRIYRLAPPTPTSPPWEHSLW
jgi:hypothetical protein